MLWNPESNTQTDRSLESVSPTSYTAPSVGPAPSGLAPSGGPAL